MNSLKDNYKLCGILEDGIYVKITKISRAINLDVSDWRILHFILVIDICLDINNILESKSNE